MTSIKLKDSLFFYLFLATSVLFIWQVIIVLSIKSGSFWLKILWSHLSSLPFVVWFQIILFWCIQLLLHLIFTSVIWITTRLISCLFSLSSQKTFKIGFLFWTIGVMTLWITNRIFYPWSIFSVLLSDLLPLAVAKVLLIILWISCITTGGLALFALAKLSFSKLQTKTFFSRCSILLLFSSSLVFYHPVSKAPLSHDKPNIILIGLDGLRPDRLSYYGYQANQTKTVDQFLSESTVFTSATTPLARTFTAWTDILTGQYPKHNHVRFNLVDQSKLSLQNTLPAILKRAGYKTIYATDETRFSNITEHFGFDTVLGPTPGSGDFLLGSVNDFPLSNLMVNTRIGQFLFPYSFANRAASTTYQPGSFIHLIHKHLHRTNDRPLFLAVHFCLSHWPYKWATIDQDPTVSSNSKMYDAAIQRLDNQFESFLKVLKQEHMLDHAIVVLLSDHGEAFALPGERLISEKNYTRGPNSCADIFNQLQTLADDIQPFDTSIGHGTDILSFTQYHVLLAFQYFGQSNAAQQVDGNVSLVDVKPTILSFLKLPLLDTDGISLEPYIENKQSTVLPRMIFLETGFTPHALTTTTISIKEAVYQNFDLFKIDHKTGHIILRPFIANQLMSTKQRAVYYGDWTLALYPIEKENKPILILVNRKTGEWTDDLNVSLTKHSPVKQMMCALQRHYGKELGWPQNSHLEFF
jgi:arylsulfatase A-like enzyme